MVDLMMPKFVCCDCNEQKDSENALESHILIDHLRWFPYECIYCREVNVSTCSPTEVDMKRHFVNIHSDKPFTILYMTDEEKKKKLMEKMERSKANSVMMQPVNNGATAETALEEASKLRSPLVPPLVDLVSPPDSPKTTTENDAAPSLTVSSPKPTIEKMRHINGFTCCHCSREFRCISQMKWHQDQAHGMNGDFSCDHCHKKFHYQYGLKTHSKSHVTPVKCGRPRKDHNNIKRQQQSTNGLPKEAVSKRNQEVSRIKRQVYFCHKCQISMPSHKVNDHLGIHHLKKVVVSCGACSFGSKWSIGGVNTHIKKVHKGENVKVIDRRPEFEAELQVLKNQLIALESSMPEALEYCLKCEKSVSVSKVNDHLRRFHLDQITMHCSECGYGTNLQTNIRRHVNGHNKNAQIIDNRPQFQDQIDKMRKEFIVSESPTSVQKPVEQSRSVVAPDHVEAVLESAASDRLPVQKLLTSIVPKKYCSDCQSSVAEDKVYRHLAENHIKEVLVKCSLCDFGTYWAMGPVKKHIEIEHKSQMKAEPVNERRKYQQELKEMKKKLIIEKY